MKDNELNYGVLKTYSNSKNKESKIEDICNICSSIHLKIELIKFVLK